MKKSEIIFYTIVFVLWIEWMALTGWNEEWVFFGYEAFSLLLLIGYVAGRSRIAKLVKLNHERKEEYIERLDNDEATIIDLRGKLIEAKRAHKGR